MEKRWIRESLGILPVILLGACSHYQLPVNHLDTPESRGGDKIGRIELLAISSSTDLAEAPTLSSPDPESTDAPVPEAQKSFAPSLGFIKGISDEIDIGVRFQPQAPLTFRFKYQIHGNPEAISKPGDMPVAISVSPGVLFGSYNGESTTYFSGDLALLAGYRLSPSNLLIVSPFFTFASLSGIPLTATLSPTASHAASQATGSATAVHYGAALGIQHSIEALFLRTELSYTKGSLGDSQISGLYVGALFGFAL